LDLDRVEELLRDHQLELVLFDPAPGNWDAGERGLAVNPDRREEFHSSIHVALETAERLGVRRLNVITGIPRPGVSDAQTQQTLVDNFAWAAEVARPSGVLLLVENINTTDMPGFWVNTAERAA